MSTFKIVSLGIRTLAKPIGNRIKAQAASHPAFRRTCINFAQRLHRIDMRWRIGLLQDPAMIDRQVAREQAEADAKRASSKDPVTTVKTFEETEAEKKEAEFIRKKLKKGRPIKPLSEAKAIDVGAGFLSETFLFLVAASLLVGERWWSSRRAKERRDELDERLEILEETVMGLRKELGEKDDGASAVDEEQKPEGDGAARSPNSKDGDQVEKKYKSDTSIASAQERNTSIPPLVQEAIDEFWQKFDVVFERYSITLSIDEESGASAGQTLRAKLKQMKKSAEGGDTSLDMNRLEEAMQVSLTVGQTLRNNIADSRVDHLARKEEVDEELHQHWEDIAAMSDLLDCYHAEACERGGPIFEAADDLTRVSPGSSWSTRDSRTVPVVIMTKGQLTLISPWDLFERTMSGDLTPMQASERGLGASDLVDDDEPDGIIDD